MQKQEKCLRMLYLKLIIKNRIKTRKSFFHILLFIEYYLIGDKMDKDIISGNHNITINQRKSINITGVKKIDNFDESEFLLETNMGYLLIKGSDLEIIKLDTYQGDIAIKGKIDNLNYLENNKKQEKKESLFLKLFK